MDPKIGLDLRARIVLSCCYLQEFSKLTHSKMGLHLGTILGANLGAKLNKTLIQGSPNKIRKQGPHTESRRFFFEKLW